MSTREGAGPQTCSPRRYEGQRSKRHGIERQNAERSNHSMEYDHAAFRSPSSGSSEVHRNGILTPENTIATSPEFVEPQPGPDYQRMESPSPRATGLKSYMSKARDLVRDFNSLPWVAAGPVTVEYDSGTARARSTRRPLVLWEKNPRLQHIVRRSPEVDLTAGESPRNVNRDSPTALHSDQSSALVSPTYVNEHGQQWPAIVPVHYDTPSSFSEGVTSIEPEERPDSPNHRTIVGSPLGSEVVTPTPPHANGALLPIPPPSPRFSPVGRWDDVNRTEDLPPPPWLSDRAPSPAASVALETRFPSNENGDIQDEMFPVPSTSTNEPVQPPPSSPIGPVQDRVPARDGGRSSPFRSLSPFFRSRPSTPSGNPQADREAHSPGRRSLLRRQRGHSLVAPNPTSHNGQVPRWLSNLIPGRRSSRRGRQNSVDTAENQTEASDSSRTSATLNTSWVDIQYSNADISDSESSSEGGETEEGSEIRLDVDGQIARAIEFEADGGSMSGTSSFSFLPAWTSPLAEPPQRHREDPFLGSFNATQVNPYASPGTRQPYGLRSTSPSDRFGSSHSPAMYGPEGVLPTHSPTDVPVVLASSTGLHRGSPRSRTTPHMSPGYYSGYVSSQPPASGSYGGPIHTGHDGYISSTIRSGATTRTHSRPTSGRTSRTGGSVAMNEASAVGPVPGGTGRRRLWPPPEPQPIHPHGAYYPGFAYPAYPAPPFYGYPNYAHRPPMS